MSLLKLKEAIDEFLLYLQSIGNSNFLISVEKPSKRSKTVLQNGLNEVNEKQPISPSPGQEVTHYAPELKTFILQPLIPANEATLLKSIAEKEHIRLDQTVLIDFNGENKKINDLLLRYYDLSPSGSIDEAARNLFATLRQAEKVDGAEYCLIHDISSSQVRNTEKISAVYDRIFRAASAKVINPSSYT